LKRFVAFLHRRRQATGRTKNSNLHIPPYQLPIELCTFRKNLSNLAFKKGVTGSRSDSPSSTNFEGYTYKEVSVSWISNRTLPIEMEHNDRVRTWRSPRAGFSKLSPYPFPNYRFDCHLSIPRDGGCLQTHPATGEFEKAPLCSFPKVFPLVQPFQNKDRRYFPFLI
jgi:hypothetical protein